jgi:hypothetical protein
MPPASQKWVSNSCTSTQPITLDFLAAFRLKNITAVINPQFLHPHTEDGDLAH